MVCTPVPGSLLHMCQFLVSLTTISSPTAKFHTFNTPSEPHENNRCWGSTHMLRTSERCSFKTPKAAMLLTSHNLMSPSTPPVMIGPLSYGPKGKIPLHQDTGAVF